MTWYLNNDIIFLEASYADRFTKESIGSFSRGL
jgi:hypothetical protein